jgi:4-amino-4-deoxy-L-arabinose transferase-like glycosyltransferase
MTMLKPFERLIDALTDPVRRERNVVWLLVAYCAAWSLYGALAKGSQDIHFDMGEMFAWSRDAGIGTPKHPPLSAWLVRAWFSLFPQTDWSYYLFAMVLATFALWVAWRVSEHYLDGEKRVAGLLLLIFVPFFNFHALKFNANTILIPLWALTTWFFLRSFETRSVIWAALAGTAATAAMMGKYWSIFLLAGLGVAALADPRRAQYFRSAAPWVTIAVGAILFAPHVAWIVANDFAPFTYAVVAHQSTLASSALSGLGFLLGVAAYVAAPIVIALVLTRPSMAAIGDSIWPRTPERRLVLIAFLAPLILPALATVLMKVEIVSLWAMSAMTLLPVVLLSSPLVALACTGLRRHADVGGLLVGELGQLRAELLRCRRATFSSRCLGST